MPGNQPKRGELYEVDPGPVLGSEQAGRRPYLIASIEPMNRAPAGLAIVLPLTTSDWSNPLHVRVEPAESGLSKVSYVMPEMARTFSTLRLGLPIGRVPLDTVDAAASHTSFLLGFGDLRY
jgi:mRNA interferase MazF